MSRAEPLARSRLYLNGDAGIFGEVDGWIRTEIRARYPALLHEEEDLGQIVHGKLVENLKGGRFRGESTLRSYVVGIVHYTAIDRLRQRYRDRALAEAWETEPGARPDDPYRSVESEHETRLLHRAVMSMPASCRQLWELAFVERLSYAEIGERLGVPAGTVKSRMWHCRRKAMAALRRLQRASRPPQL